MRTSFTSLSVLFWIAAVVICPSFAVGQVVKAAVVSTTLEPNSFRQWSQDLGYAEPQLYPVTLGSSGLPFVDVDISGIKLPLMLDTGTARGFVITNQAPSVPHHVEGRIEELNPDDSHWRIVSHPRRDNLGPRGSFQECRGQPVRLENVLLRTVQWNRGARLFPGSASDFGLPVTESRCDGAPLPEKLDRKRDLSVDLVETPKRQGHILYVRAKVNGREAIVHFDTGFNVSFIDPTFAEGLTRVERPGKFKVFRERVPMELDVATHSLLTIFANPRSGAEPALTCRSHWIWAAMFCPASSSPSISAPRGSSSH